MCVCAVAEAEQLLGPMSLQAKRLAVQEEYVLLLPGKRDQLEFHLQLPASLQWNQANEQFAYLSWDVAKIHMGNVVWNTRAVKHCQKKQIQEVRFSNKGLTWVTLCLPHATSCRYHCS